MEKTIVITGAGLARELLKDGEQIIDIKPHRQIKNASVFVFKSTDNIKRKIKERKNE